MVGGKVLHRAWMCSKEPLSIFEIFFDLDDHDGGACYICKDPSIG